MYLDHFGLREKPFNVTPDPRFFFGTTAYREAYASLLYGVRERRGFIVLTGEVGTGKTTLLRRLMEGLGPDTTFAFIYQRYDTFDGLLTAVCKDLGLPVAQGDTAEKIDVLNAYLLQQLNERKTVVLLIDEAQNLSNDILESLRLLSNLETSSDKLLQIVLSGQPELDRKLEARELRQLKQRVAIYSRLDRLKPREVRSYIEHRLTTAGYPGNSLFTLGAISGIASYSQGIPRLINVLCDNALVHAFASAQWSVQPAAIAEVAADLGLTGGQANGYGENPPIISPQVEPEEDRPRETGRVRWRPLFWTGVVAIGWFLIVLVGTYAIDGERTFGRIAQSEKSAESQTLSAKSKGQSEKSTELRVLSTENETQSAKRQAQSVRSADWEQKGDSALSTRHSTLATQHSASEAEATEQKAEATEKGGYGVQLANGFQLSPGKQGAFVVREGDTAIGIAHTVYGKRSTLGLDLMDEFNPGVGNLHHIAKGEKLWLPPLTEATLTRKRPDGTFDLIAASYMSPAVAEEFAHALRRKGLKVAIAPRTIAGGLEAHRVVILQLQSLQEVNRIWRVVNNEMPLPAAADSGSGA